MEPYDTCVHGEIKNSQSVQSMDTSLTTNQYCSMFRLKQIGVNKVVNMSLWFIIHVRNLI